MFFILSSGHKSQIVPEKDTRPEEWRLVFQSAVSEIQFFKGQQWKVTNYALLLYGGLAAFFPKGSAWPGLFYVLVGIVCGGAILFLTHLEAAIRRARCRLEKAKANFMIKLDPSNSSWFVVLALSGVLIVGAALLCVGWPFTFLQPH